MNVISRAVPPHYMHARENIYIDGKWVAASGEGNIEVVNPATEQCIGSVPVGSAIVANNYFWLHGRKPFKENKDLSRELLRIRGSFFIN